VPRRRLIQRESTPQIPSKLDEWGRQKSSANLSLRAGVKKFREEIGPEEDKGLPRNITSVVSGVRDVEKGSPNGRVGNKAED